MRISVEDLNIENRRIPSHYRENLFVVWGKTLERIFPNPGGKRFAFPSRLLLDRHALMATWRSLIMSGATPGLYVS